MTSAALRRACSRVSSCGGRAARARGERGRAGRRGDYLWRGKRGHRQLVKTVRHTLGTVDELTLDAELDLADNVLGLVAGLLGSQ
jgi:hypothetical protein